MPRKGHAQERSCPGKAMPRRGHEAVGCLSEAIAPGPFVPVAARICGGSLSCVVVVICCVVSCASRMLCHMWLLV